MLGLPAGFEPLVEQTSVRQHDGRDPQYPVVGSGGRLHIQCFRECGDGTSSVVDPQVGRFDDNSCEERLHIALVLGDVSDLGGECCEFSRAPCWSLCVRADEWPLEIPDFAEALSDS